MVKSNISLKMVQCINSVNGNGGKPAIPELRLSAATLAGPEFRPGCALRPVDVPLSRRVVCRFPPVLTRHKRWEARWLNYRSLAVSRASAAPVSSPRA
jgi:hypothetical protein